MVKESSIFFSTRMVILIYFSFGHLYSQELQPDTVSRTSFHDKWYFAFQYPFQYRTVSEARPGGILYYYNFGFMVNIPLVHITSFKSIALQPHLDAHRYPPLIAQATVDCKVNINERFSVIAGYGREIFINTMVDDDLQEDYEKFSSSIRLGGSYEMLENEIRFRGIIGMYFQLLYAFHLNKTSLLWKEPIDHERGLYPRVNYSSVYFVIGLIIKFTSN